MMSVPVPDVPTTYELLPLPPSLKHVFRFENRWYATYLERDERPGALVRLLDSNRLVKIGTNTAPNGDKFPTAASWRNYLRPPRQTAIASPLETITMGLLGGPHPDSETVSPYRVPDEAELTLAAFSIREQTVTIDLLVCLLYREHELRRYTVTGLRSINGRGGQGTGYQGELTDGSAALTLYFNPSHGLDSIALIALG